MPKLDDAPDPDGQNDVEPPRRVFVSGAGGFVGSAVVSELLRRGCAVNALLHRGDLDTPAGADVKTVRGDLFDGQALDLAMRGADAAIHLVGIIAERPKDGTSFERVHVGGTRAVVDAAVRLGVPRYLHMSALGTRANAPSRYHQTKWTAEQYVRENAPAWTIFRPSMIHGPSGEFMRQEATWARGRAAPFLFMPYFGAGALGRGGAGKLQPVYVGDVAAAFADALEKPHTVGRAYTLAGPDVMTWPQMHRIASEVIRGRPRRAAAIPAWTAKLLAAFVPGPMLPFNRDQVLMSQEDNTGDVADWLADFGTTPQPFRETLEEYAGRL